jgi:hypothetical protein
VTNARKTIMKPSLTFITALLLAPLAVESLMWNIEK